MTAPDLLERLELGEDSTFELKSVRFRGNRVEGPGRDSLADELAAFANTRGGTVVLGVSDKNRKVEGVPLDRLDDVETWLRSICMDSIKPALDADIIKMKVPGIDQKPTPVVCIRVPRSFFVHKSPGGYYRRIGSSKTEMTPEHLVRLLEERSRTQVIPFDKSIVPDTTPEDLHYSLAQRFLNGDIDNVPSTPEESLLTLRKMMIVADDDAGRTRLTLAGVLFCTQDPQQWLPHAYIQAVSYAGERTDIDYQTDARDFGGPLNQQVAEALHFVRRNMLVRAAKHTARTERPQFSDVAVFEALVNAVAHRDYSMTGTRIRLHMFGDRLELYVPGALANTMTTDALHLRQSSRNELIVSLLARCPAPTDVGRTRLMDRRGDGVPRIRRETWKLSGTLPEYTLLEDAELQLILRAAS